LLKFTKEGMKVKVIGIYASSRKGLKSDMLLDSGIGGAYEKGIEVKRIYVRDLRF
jgi:multimeric flavodoxin WrbA